MHFFICLLLVVFFAFWILCFYNRNFYPVTGNRKPSHFDRFPFSFFENEHAGNGQHQFWNKNGNENAFWSPVEHNAQQPGQRQLRNVKHQDVEQRNLFNIADGITIEMEDVLNMGSVAQVKELLKKYNVEVAA